MVIIKIILIYFWSNFLLRFMIDLVLFLLIKVTCLLIEYIDKKLEKFITWLIDPRMTNEVEDLHDVKGLNTKKIIKSLLICIGELIKERYCIPSDLKDSMLIKFKYSINKSIDNLYNKMYKLTLCNKSLKKSEKILCYIKSGLKLCIFNFFILALIYWHFIEVNIVTLIMKYIKSLKYDKYLDFLIFVISIPIIKTIWNYTRIKLLFKNECDELENKYVQLYDVIDKNIEELNTYKINNGIKRVAYEITDNIGFEFDVYDGKLKVKQRFRKFHNKERRVNLLCINNETKKIEDFIKDKFIKKNKDRNIFNQWFFYTSYVFEGNENSVLCYKLKENYQDIRRYFQKNHNQIYKRKFTNVRVIKEEQINCLDYQIEKCEKWLENYRSEIKEYILGILILRYKARKHLNYMNRSIFSTSFTDILKTIVYISIKEYYIIIRKILY